jgi:hypothetical protein
MGARFRSILVVTVILIIAIALIIVGYGFEGTGFSGYNKVSTATEATVTPHGGGPPQKVTTTVEPQPSKNL